MAEPSRSGATTTKHTVQHIMNTSYDQEMGINGVELIAWDSVNNLLRRVTTDSLSFYGTNDIDSASDTVVYEGLEDCDGNWQIVKIETTGTITSNRFATFKNNPTYTSYANAWTDRTELTYETYGEAF